MKVIQPHESTAATNERLAKITATVKNLINLNTDQYSHFTGDLDDNPLYPVWRLSWENDDDKKSLKIDVTEGGIIEELWRHEPRLSQSSQDKIHLHFPTLPDGKVADAKKSAVTFLRRVLKPNESFNFIEQYNESIFSDYNFNGIIFKNHLPAGIRFSIAVRCSDNLVIRFDRNQEKVIGELPPPFPKLTEEEAVSLLRNTISLYLEYRKSNKYRSYAVLQYLPQETDIYYVDAQTGNMVDLTVLLEKKEYRQSRNINLSDDDDDWSLLEDSSFKGHHFSKAEIKTISRLNIPSQEKLDLTVRKISFLGLNSYKLDIIKYEDKSDSNDEQDSPVIATLTYITTETHNSSKGKTIRINSKTGELLSVSSFCSTSAELVLSIALDEALKIAESFLQEITPDIFFKCKLVKAEAANSDTSHNWFHSFRYDRQENEFFYHQNYIEICIDASDGSVSDYYFS